METTRTASQGGGLKVGLRSTGRPSGTASTQEVGEARSTHPGNRLGRSLETAYIVTMLVVIAFGIGLIAFGVTLAFTVDAGAA